MTPETTPTKRYKSSDAKIVESLPDLVLAAFHVLQSFTQKLKLATN